MSRRFPTILRPANIPNPAVSLPQAPPPSLPHRDYRHFFGAAAILTSLGEYGGAQQHLKHGLRSKQKHFAKIQQGSASKTCIICRFSQRCNGPLQELVWCSRTTPWQRGLMQRLTTDLTDLRYLPEAHIVTENSPSSVFICTCFCSHFLPPASAPLK